MGTDVAVRQPQMQIVRLYHRETHHVSSSIALVAIAVIARRARPAIRKALYSCATAVSSASCHSPPRTATANA